MRHQPMWQQHELPEDFLATHVVTGAFGLAMFGGNRGDRAALAFTWPTVKVVDLDDGGLLTVASNGGTIIAATAAGGQYWAYPPDGFGPGSFDRHHLPRSPSGELPVMAWGSSADREFRLVIAYPAENGHELRVWSDAADDLVTTANTLYAPHDLSGIQVTGHQGCLLVGGPVSADPPEARACQVWLLDDPDFGDGAWAPMTLDPAPVALTHQMDGAVDWWWVGHDGQRITVWSEDTAVAVPDVLVDCAEPRAFLAASPHTVATQTAEGSFLRWLDEGQSRKAPLPAGKLQGALWSPGQPDAPTVPSRVHVVVEGKAWWMDWTDVQLLGD
jgi:hypothetical protein